MNNKNKESAKIQKAILELRDRPPKTKEELNYYLIKFYGVHLAKRAIDEENSSPLDFVWDIYSTAMGFFGVDSTVFNFLGCAARGSQKSLSCAVLECLLLTHDKYRDWFHMASIKEQSYVTYQYFRTFLSRKIMAGVASEPTMRETISRHGRQLKIGTATMDSVNSFHGSVVQDELDLTPTQIFNESKGMLSAQRGRMPLNIAISSRKFAVGNIQTLLDKAKKDIEFPLKVHKWGILEITEKCKPDRHGEYGTEIYVNEDDLVAIPTEEYDNIAGVERSKYIKKIGYENCLKCGIFSFCQGRLPNQDEGNPHLQPIELTKTFFKTDSLDFFKSQRLNKKPSTEGLIYPSWDEEVHVKTYGQMWEIFHGEPHPDLVKNPTTGRPKRFDIGKEELFDAFIKAGCRCVVGVDFGFSVLAVCGLYFLDGSGRVFFVDELSYTQHSDTEVAEELKRNWGTLPVDEVIADPESPGGRKEIQKITGWGIRQKVDKNVKEGIESMRRILRIPGTRKTKFYVSLNCTVFRQEIKTYKNKIDVKSGEVLQEVDKKQDHSLDQARYVIHTILGQVLFDGDFASKDRDIKDFDPNKPLRAPTATEMANVLGTSFLDNRDEFILDPETKKLRQRTDKDDNGGSNSGGGSNFNFSF